MKQPLRRILSNSESDARAWTVFQSAAAHASLALVPVEWGLSGGACGHGPGRTPAIGRTVAADLPGQRAGTGDSAWRRARPGAAAIGAAGSRPTGPADRRNNLPPLHGRPSRC